MYKERVKRVCAKMKERGLGQLLVTDPVSIFYLTGIKVHPGERFWALLLGAEEEELLFANRLFALSGQTVETVLYSDSEDIRSVVPPHIKSDMVGADKNMAARFLLPIMESCRESSFVLGSDCVDEVRAVKDETEKERLRISSRINDECMEKLAAFMHEGVTERECGEYLKGFYAAQGCEGLSFDPGIAFGKNAGDPHHKPDDTVLKEGDCIVIDIGCIKDDYCSDMTRTFFWKKADPEYVRIYNIVREANEKAEALVKEGVPICDIDAAAREHIASFGYGEYFTHRLGHFIGLEDHEKGDVSSVNTDPAVRDMVFSIEPGVYLQGRFGVRIEDLVIVTEEGCEILNHVDKELCILGV